MTAVAVLLLSIPSAAADPGAPGLNQPSNAVYERTEERTSIGQPTPGTGNGDNTPQSPVGGQPGAGGGSPGGEGGGGGSSPGGGGSPGGDSGGGGGGDVASVAGTDESLPFTGLSAALVLGAGLTTLLLGFAIRAGSSRQRRV